jgi:hypothetical protein
LTFVPQKLQRAFYSQHGKETQDNKAQDEYGIKAEHLKFAGSAVTAYLGVLACADDLILLAPSEAELNMQTLLTTHYSNLDLKFTPKNPPSV